MAYEVDQFVGVVHGIEETFRVFWVGPDEAHLTTDGGKPLAFASVRSGGFISADDVHDQARDVVAAQEEAAL